MAKKMKLMALFQELSGRALVTNRRPAPPASGVYLMQLRAQTGALTLPRRRFMISVDLRQTQPLPHPVKITHVRAVEGSPDPEARPARLAVNGDKASVPQVRPKAG